MKKDMKENNYTYSDIDAQYLMYHINTLRKNGTLYKLLQTTTIDKVAIHHLNTNQSTCKDEAPLQPTKPQRILSLPEFIEQAQTFHNNDRFALSLANGICTLNTQLDAEILLLLLEKETTKPADNHSEQKHKQGSNQLDKFARKYRLSPAEKQTINHILDKTPTITKPSDETTMTQQPGNYQTTRKLE